MQSSLEMHASSCYHHSMNSRWLNEFRKTNPELIPLLNHAGISDDDSYREREPQLTPELRRSLALSRFSGLLEDQNPNDPCLAASYSPPWVSRRRWSELPVTQHTTKLFAEKGIHLVSDLEKYTSQQLLQYRYFGEKALSKVCAVIKDAISEGPGPGAGGRKGSAGALAATSSWISALYVLSQEQAMHMQMAGITSDSTFLELECRLDPALRHSLGIFRSRHLLPANRSNMSQLVASLPPWLTNRDVASLPIPITTFDLCHAKGVVHVADMEHTTLTTTSKYRVSHQGHVRKLLAVLEQELEEGPKTAPKTLLDTIDAFQDLLSDEYREIFQARLGLRRPKQTLQSTGKFFSISRQNVFLKEQQLFVRLCEFWDLQGALSKRLRALLDRSKSPLPLLTLPELDPWFAGCTTSTSMMQMLMRRVLNNEVSVLEIDKVNYVSVMNSTQWQWLMRIGKEKTAIAFSRSWNDSLCRIGLTNYLSTHTQEMAPLLWEKVKTKYLHCNVWGRHLRIPNDKGTYTAKLLKLLNSFDHTLHYRTVAEVAAERFDVPVEEDLILAILREAALSFGRGHYGLHKHLRVNRPQMKKLAQNGEAIVQGSHVPWRCADILNKFPIGQLPPTADRYHLDVALGKSGKLMRVGFQKWLDPQSATGMLKEIIWRTGMFILEDVGKPLPEKELVQRIATRLHLEEPFVLLPEDPLLPCGTGLWGLNDRDFHMKHKQQPEFLDAVVQCLRKVGSEFPVSQLGKRMGKKLTAGDLGLLAMDSRIDVSGRKISLTEW
ncbi:MAG: hypothetical protein LBR22_01395 [Desulfovibrio sp.]|nr:hypothetical protein [Desulfovibrio sp.]